MEKIQKWLMDHLTAAGLVATATIGLLIIAGLSYFAPNNTPVVVTETGQVYSVGVTTTLTADINSYRYQHAQSGFRAQQEEWQEKWVDDLDVFLERQEKPEEFRETVAEVMKEFINDNIELNRMLHRDGIAEADRLYIVRIVNDGSIPLKDVFLRISGSAFWVERESRRLMWAGNPIVIGDLAQKEKKYITLWVDEFEFTHPPEIIFGHASGLGVVTLDEHR